MMNYILEFEELFENCIKQEREREITIYQGNGYTQSFGGLVDFFRKENDEIKNSYLDKLSNYIENPNFQKQIVILKKDNIKKENGRLEARIKKEPDNVINRYRLDANKELLVVLDWSWIKTNFYEVFSKNLPTIVSDWRICLLDDLFKEYKRSKNIRFEYKSDNPLKDYYWNKGVDLKMDDNYELFPVLTDFQIKANGLPKIYDKKNNTHIIIRYVPNDFVRFIIDLMSKERFDIAFRPDYNISGDNIKDLCLITEGVVRGEPFNMCVSQLPKLSELIDYTETNNRLIIKKEIKRDTQELTFEELVDDFEVYDNSIVSQVVHLQYLTEGKKEYITHIDHEYVFYTLSDYETKLDDTKSSNLTIKGDYRPPFKTFKIDKAKIEFVLDANENIVVQTLKAFFKNDVLINEYFEKLIQS